MYKIGLTKSHEPVGQFVIFEKFTSAYLFQIARGKSCDYLLTICMKKGQRLKESQIKFYGAGLFILFIQVIG